MANIVYMRVSTKEQNLDRQVQLFKDNNINIDKVFQEKISGKNMERPQLQAMLDYVRENDTVFVESISRLARNTKDLLEIIEKLTAKKVLFVSLKENIDTTTPQGKLILSIFSALSQFERECIKERQAEGIKVCLEKGRPYGRPKKEISKAFAVHYKAWKAGKIKAVDFMKMENLTKTTFYKLVKEYESTL